VFITDETRATRASSAATSPRSEGASNPASAFGNCVQTKALSMHRFRAAFDVRRSSRFQLKQGCRAGPLTRQAAARAPRRVCCSDSGIRRSSKRVIAGRHGSVPADPHAVEGHLGVRELRADVRAASSAGRCAPRGVRCAPFEQANDRRQARQCISVTPTRLKIIWACASCLAMRAPPGDGRHEHRQRRDEKPRRYTQIQVRRAAFDVRRSPRGVRCSPFEQAGDRRQVRQCTSGPPRG
jgi:hypothetical protein